MNTFLDNFVSWEKSKLIKEEMDKHDSLRDYVYKLRKKERREKIDDILNNQDFLLVLYNQQKKYDEYKFQLKEIRTTLNQLKTDIEKELEK